MIYVCGKEREEEQDEGETLQIQNHVSRNEIAKSFNALLQLWT